MYYSIGEVAKLFEVNSSLIRFWEKEFGIKIEKKSANGKRLFSLKDIEELKEIYTLVKIKGFTIEGAKKSLKMSTKSTENPKSNKTEIIHKLEEIKLKLKSMI